MSACGHAPSAPSAPSRHRCGNWGNLCWHVTGIVAMLGQKLTRKLVLARQSESCAEVCCDGRAAAGSAERDGCARGFGRRNQVIRTPLEPLMHCWFCLVFEPHRQSCRTTVPLQRLRTRSAVLTPGRAQANAPRLCSWRRFCPITADDDLL